MRIVPITLHEANDLVTAHHRHHKPARGARFCLGLEDDDHRLVGAVIIGRPVARHTDYRKVAEVTRLVTDGTPNACSMLYGAAARVAKEMGFERIQTFILAEELGTSLKAAGWSEEHTTSGGAWNRSTRPVRRHDQPETSKVRWSRQLGPRS